MLGTNCIDSCLPCGPHTPRRNRYFDGKLLVARDFSDEQDYHRGHRQMHNALLHGSGTVCGLKLVAHPALDCQRKFLVLKPGYALDCCGREIIVPSDTLFPVQALIEAADPALQAKLAAGNDLFLAIRRCDRGDEAVPQILPGCGCESETRFSRTAEGFELVILAPDQSEVTPVSVPFAPDLAWVHTLSYDAQTPNALALDEDLDWLLVAATADEVLPPDEEGSEAIGSSRAYVHLMENSDLVTAIDGPRRATDIVAHGGANLNPDRVYLGGLGYTVDEKTGPGIGVWPRDELRYNPSPLGVMPMEGATRLVLSPKSDTLFVLDFVEGKALLKLISAQAVTDWLDNGSGAPVILSEVPVNHDFSDEDGPALRGASMMRISDDGRFLALLASDQPAAKSLYIYRINALASDTPTLDQDPISLDSLGLPENERLIALRWSLDGTLLFLLSQLEDTLHLWRCEFSEGDEKPTLFAAGRGLQLPGQALDLTVAPGEHWAYVLFTNADGRTELAALDLELAAAKSSAGPDLASGYSSVIIDGAGRNLSIDLYGHRIYVAAADANEETAPDRGMVAVIDVGETDFGVLFDDAINGCPTCEQSGEDHAVILGHLPGYVWGETPPRIVDEGDGDGGEDTVEIDNLTYRPIVPSAATLKEVVEAILAAGIAEGPPGPRGEPGQDGADGADGTNGAAGAPGTDGASVDSVDLIVLDPGSEPTLQSTQDEDGDWHLTFGLPQATPAETLDLNSIVALGWVHGSAYPSPIQDTINSMDTGIAIAFARPVLFSAFTGSESAGASMLVELQRRAQQANGGDMTCWGPLDRILVAPLESSTYADGVIQEFKVAESADLAWGIVIYGDDVSLEVGEVLRVILHCDFIVEKEDQPALDGNFQGARLPTGNGRPGNDFISWFTVPKSDSDTRITRRT